MALKIAEDLSKEFRGKYCKIISISPNSLYQNTVVKVAAYDTKESRDKDEAGYLASRLVTIPGTGHTRDTAYAQLKLKAEFEGSTDC